MLFVDPAFITFEIINSGSFVFSEMRYGAFITQLFPLLTSKLGLPLKIVLILYSASFYIFFISVIYISGHILRQYKLAILFSLYLSLLVTDVFFWPNNEIHQAVGWMILFLSLYNWSEQKKKQDKIWIHILLIIFLFLATISHLLIILPLGFLWVFQGINDRKFNKHISKPALIYSICILAFVAFRYWLSHSSWYDGAKLSGVKNVSIDKLFAAFSNDQAKSIIQLSIPNYWLQLLIFIIGQFLLLKNKKFILAGFTMVSAIAYFILVTLTHSAEVTSQNLFYFESQWMCWSILLSTPFVIYIFDYVQNKKVIMMIFIFIFLSKVPYLNTSLTKFQDRLSALETLVLKTKKQNVSKSYINTETYNSKDMEKELLMSWGLPVESLLLSSIDTKSPSSTIKKFDEKDKISVAKDSIYTAFKFVHIDELNPMYFKLDSDSKYEKLLDID